MPDFGTTSAYSTTTSLTSGSGSIDFNVMAGTSGGLSGATVTDNTSGKTCVTAGPGETLGKCTISDLSSGSHTFRVIRDGYDLLDVTANIQSGRTVSQAVSLSTGTGDVHLTAINAQNGTTALSGVTFSTSGKTDCITNPCTFSALPLSLKNFVAKKNGYEDAYITVDVTTGITSLKVAMIPSNTNTLNVTVLDSISRSAIQGVAVTRDNATVCNNEQDNVTNALGACTGTNQNAGSVRLNASKVGYETTTATASIISRDSDVIILMRPTSILLSVYDSAGASLSGVTVSYGTNWSNSCTEAPTGTFTCPNLTTAATPLKISKDSNYVSQYISAYLGTGPLSIVLNRVASPGTLTVNVVDQNNNAVSGTTIKIDDVECTQVSNICTKTGLAAGQYLIQASKDGENGYMTISMTAEATTKVIIVVRTLPTAATTSFSLYDSSDQPVPVATVTPSSGSCATTDTSGTYNCSGLLLIPTAFRIDAEGFDSIFVNTTPTTASNGSVKVILSRKVATVNTLNVTVVDATSPTTFLAGAIVNQCVSTSNSNGTTDANGMCTKSDIAVGPLPVEVSKTDYEPAYTTVTISSTGQTSLKVALRPTNAKIYFNIFDSRTGQPLEATVTGVSVDPYVCASGACSISPSAKGVLSISVANIAGGYLTANATVGYLGYPVVLNLYLTPISTLTVTFPEFSPSVTVTVSGSTTYTCTGLSASSTSCIISNLPYGYYTLTSNSGKAGSVSVYQPNSSVDLS